MTFKFVNQVAFFFLAVLVVFSSCTDEDPILDIVPNEEEPVVVEPEFTPISISDSETGGNDEILSLEMTMNVNGTSVQTNAVAAYCDNDSVEFIMVSNKQEHLSFPMSTENFEENDFVYFKSITDGTTWAYGGQALGQTVTGFPGLSILFSDANMGIYSNNGQVIVGTSSGTLMGFDAAGNWVSIPYTANFAANIIQTSDYCD